MRYLLALFIFFLTTVDVFGWTLSLAPGLSIKNAILYVILLTLSARFVVRGGMRWDLPQLHLWFGVLIAYATLSWLVAGMVIQYTGYNFLSSGINLKVALFDNAIIFMLYLYGTQTFRDAMFLLKCILLAVTGANAIALGNFVGIFHIGVTTIGSEGNLAGRVFGAFGHANETAALIVCLLPAYIAAALSSRGVARVLWALAGVISATLMVMTGSRGAFVALALTTVIGSYICRDLISWRRAATLVVTVGAIAVPVLAIVSIESGGILAHRVVDMILDPSTSSEDRTYIWRPVLDKMMANPVTLITGFGWDVYSSMGFFYATHNYYLSLWFELGIVGVASFLLMVRELVTTARRAARNAPNESATYLVAFVYGIIGLSGAIFFTPFYKPWLYVWPYIGLTMRMAVIAMQPLQTKVRNEPRGAADHRGTPAITSHPTAARRPGTLNRSTMSSAMNVRTSRRDF
jgi:O-antigen ligase